MLPPAPAPQCISRLHVSAPRSPAGAASVRCGVSGGYLGPLGATAEDFKTNTRRS